MGVMTGVVNWTKDSLIDELVELLINIGSQGKWHSLWLHSDQSNLRIQIKGDQGASVLP